MRRRPQDKVLQEGLYVPMQLLKLSFCHSKMRDDSGPVGVGVQWISQNLPQVLRELPKASKEGLGTILVLPQGRRDFPCRHTAV